MWKKNLFRAGSLLTASMLMLSQLAAMPASADGRFNADDIASCNYVFDVNKPLTTADAAETNGYDTSLVFSCADIGVSGAETVTEVWFSFEGEAGKKIMPAIGYNAPGFNEDDWYADSVIISEGTGNIVFDIPAEYPLPDEFMLQNWWGDIDTFTVLQVGLVTDGGSNIGVATRRGDCNDDKAINIADAVALCAFLTEGRAFAVPANGDMDKNNALDARDLTLLKRKLLTASSGDNGQTAMEFVSNIKIGWNLGNTLDATSEWATNAYGFETAWGNPYTTEAMIQAVKDAGFNTIRVPVTWTEKMGAAPDYLVDEEWMNRVQQVVDYVIDNGMYCILNSHHDTTWQRPRKDVLDANNAQLKALWTQIANRFADYDQHLIFETLNEPRLVNDPTEWTGGDAEARECVASMNSAALEAIRATGGNNTTRFVMLPTYCATINDATTSAWLFPKDDHVIVSAHAYTPYNFALNKTGTSTWGNDTYDILQLMKTLKTKFIDNDIPVIIGEFGAMNKNNESERAQWVEYYVKTADEYGIPCVWWDNNAFEGDGENFGLLRRSDCTIVYPDMLAAMMRGVANRG